MGSEMIDIPRLIGEVAARHGIRLEPNDPAFALVTLNQLVLEETVTAFTTNVSLILTRFSDSLNKTERHAGVTLAQQVRNATGELRATLLAASRVQDGSPMTSSNRLKPVDYKWASLGLLCGMLFCAIGVAVGTLIASR